MNDSFKCSAEHKAVNSFPAVARILVEIHAASGCQHIRKLAKNGLEELDRISAEFLQLKQEA